jgi:hypothetical protein
LQGLPKYLRIDCVIIIKNETPRQFRDFIIDRSQAWVFFDKAKQDPKSFSSARGLLHISNVHKVSFKAGLGIGSNNYAEFQKTSSSVLCTNL